MDSAETKPLGPVKNRRKHLIFSALILVLLIIAGVYFFSPSASSPSVTPQIAKQVTQVTTPKVQLALMATGLPNPTGIISTNQVSDRRLFVLDQTGIVRIVSPDGSILPTPFLDISAQVMFGGEMGLLGLAFSPNYPQDGYFFINYIDKAQNTIIARYRVSADKDKADPTTGQVLLTLKQPYENHNGGNLAFGPDGYLYIGLGDGGSGSDPENRAQNLSVLFGKILRLDVSQVPYKVPPTNPFINQAGSAPEVWDYGLRNPWRFSFDRKTHDLYIADVGQGSLEELNVEMAGGKGGNNYGWHCFEGSSSLIPLGCQSKDKYVFPVLEYAHTEGRCSITGGYVYRGQRYTDLVGKYFYTDYCGGQLYLADRQAGAWQSSLATQTPYKISVFGEDNQGELYLADYSTGSLYRIQDKAN
jgi:glucose/arabinose dehydrogenase